MTTTAPTTLHPALTVSEAAAALLQAKNNRDAANAAVLAAERSLLALVGELPQEGTKRADTDDYRIAVRCSMSRDVDKAKLREIAPQIPEAVGKRLIKWEPGLVMTELRFLQLNEPELYAVVAAAITAKPGKPSIEIEFRGDAAKAA